MGYYWDKRLASWVINTQTLAYTGSGTVVSTNLTPDTYQVRLISQVAGRRSIERQERRLAVQTVASLSISKL